jgi:hypothetical protein
MISLLGMDVPRSWSVSIGILLRADRDAQFAGHAEYAGNESADWKMPENISSEFWVHGD